MVLISSGAKKKKGQTVADIIAAAQAKAVVATAPDLDKHFVHLKQADNEARERDAAKQRAMMAAENLQRKEQRDAEQAELAERLLAERRIQGARRIQMVWRDMQTIDRGLARQACREELHRTKAERAAVAQELRRFRDAAATQVQSLWRGYASRVRAFRLRSIHTDLAQKIPIGSSAPKAAGAAAKQVRVLLTFCAPFAHLLPPFAHLLLTCCSGAPSSGARAGGTARRAARRDPPRVSVHGRELDVQQGAEQPVCS